jgi:hypothetical protein
MNQYNNQDLIHAIERVMLRIDNENKDCNPVDGAHALFLLWEELNSMRLEEDLEQKK